MSSETREPRIVLLGLPNVGKSALFNGLAGQSLAIVFDRPGVTRDCRYATFNLGEQGPKVTLVDTPGLPLEFAEGLNHKTPAAREAKSSLASSSPEAVLGALMAEQTLAALRSADLILFLFDGKVANQQNALEIFRRVRKLGRPLLPVVNKSDALRRGAVPIDLYSLGQDLLLASAVHRRGLENIKKALRSRLAPLLPSANEESIDGVEEDAEQGLEAAPGDTTEASAEPLSLTIMGRPNVGKSTLVNALLGRQVQLVADLPGVTRDSVEFCWTYRGREFRLCDTAGIRRKARVHDSLEKVTSSLALKNARRADVCVLVMDAVEIEASEFGELLQQDLLLAQRVLEEGRCVILALNKWDLVRDKKSLKSKVEHSLQFAAHLKDVFWLPLSAEKKKGIHELLEQVLQIERAWGRHLPTSQLNSWLREVVAACPPPASGLRPPKLKYVTQVSTKPPRFVIFGNKMDSVPETYRRFLQGQLREAFQLHGVPLFVQWRQQENPFAGKAAPSHKSQDHSRVRSRNRFQGRSSLTRP